MNFFGIGLPEMAVIAAIGLLVFGPKRLPELGKTLGRTLRGFQSASQEFEKEFRTAIGTETGSDGLLADAAAASDLSDGPSPTTPASSDGENPAAGSTSAAAPLASPAETGPS
jgi:sec-independent protein translocase protein TatA